MPLPKTVPNPYTEAHRQAALRILQQADDLGPVCESLARVGVACDDLRQSVEEIRTATLAWLAEFFPE